MGSVEFLPDVKTAADLDGHAEDLTRMLSASARAAHRRYCATAWKSGDWAEPADDTRPPRSPTCSPPTASCPWPTGNGC